MTRTRRLLCLAGGLALLGFAGCGGSAPAIQHRMPMDNLWHTPPEQRDPVAKAHRQLYEVQARLDHTRFELEDTKREAAIARAERDRAESEIRIAELQKDRREAGYLMKLASAASKAISSAKSDKQALDRKIRWLDERTRYLEREVAHLEAATVAAEAKLELAKAELAAKKGVIGKEVGLADFKAQAQRAEARAADKRRAAEEARRRSSNAEKAWKGS